MNKKSKPTFNISGGFSIWYLDLKIPKMRFEAGMYTRRRDAKRAAFRAARLLGLNDFDIKFQ